MRTNFDCFSSLNSHCGNDHTKLCISLFPLFSKPSTTIKTKSWTKIITRHVWYYFCECCDLWQPLYEEWRLTVAVGRNAFLGSYLPHSGSLTQEQLLTSRPISYYFTIYITVNRGRLNSSRESSLLTAKSSTDIPRCNSVIIFGFISFVACRTKLCWCRVLLSLKFGHNILYSVVFCLVVLNLTISFLQSAVYSTCSRRYTLFDTTSID